MNGEKATGSVREFGLGIRLKDYRLTPDDVKTLISMGDAACMAYLYQIAGRTWRPSIEDFGDSQQ